MIVRPSSDAAFHLAFVAVTDSIGGFAEISRRIMPCIFNKSVILKEITMDEFNKPSMLDRSVFFGILVLFAIFYVLLISIVLSR